MTLNLIEKIKGKGKGEMTKKIPSISFSEIEEKLYLVNITDTYQVGNTLRIASDDGEMTELPLAETLAKLGIDLAGRKLVICSAFGSWLTFDTRVQPSIYELAQQAVEERAVCFPDGNVIIWEGVRVRVRVRVYRYQDTIQMDLINGEPKLAERVQVGMLYPDGWRFTLSGEEYSRWVSRARRLV